MAIAFDAFSTNSTTTWGSGVSSVTWSHTCSGANRILFVAVFDQGNGVEPTGITYGGVALTKINGVDIGSGGFRNSLWYLIAPATGANNVVVTWASANGLFNCGAISYTGAKQTGQPDSNNTGATSPNTSLTVATTTVADNCWIVGIGCSDVGGTLGGTNFTARNGALPGSLRYGDSAADLTPAGSKNTTFTNTGSGGMALAVASFAPHTATDVSVSATVLTATFSIPAATISGGATVSPNVQSVVASIQAPTVSGGATISPSVLSAVFSIPTPNIITPDAQVDVGVLSATFSIQSPVASCDVDVPVGVQSATFSIPTVSFIGSVSITPDVQGLSMTVQVPAVEVISNVVLDATVVTATFSIQSPTVTAEQNALVDVGVLSATFTIPTVSVTATQSVTISAPVFSATFSVLAPTKVGGLWTAQPRVQGTWTPQPRAI